MPKASFADLIDPETRTMVGKLNRTPIRKQRTILDEETGRARLDGQGNPITESVTTGYEYEVNRDVSELDLFELNPDWPPAGFREDPEKPGHLLPTETSERDRVVAGLLSIESIADLAMNEINTRFGKVFSDLEAKYPSAERDDWPYLIADAKRVSELSDEKLNTEANRKAISFIGIEVLGSGYDPTKSLTVEELARIRSKAGKILAKSGAFRFAIAGAKHVKQVSQASIAEATKDEETGRAYDAIQSALASAVFQSVSEIDERAMYRLDPNWPPAGYREEPANSGLLVPEEKVEKETIVGKLVTKIRG